MAKKIMAAAVAGPRRVGRYTVLRITGYYLVVTALLLLLTALFPTEAMSPVDAAPTGMAEGLEWLRWRLAVLPTGSPRWVEASVQMLAALLLVIPLAYTYVRTRTRLKYDHSLVQTVVMLPIVVTSILVVVRDSLALAFSLAGIVAAVRFRNNLREAGDAVYIFGSIGVGFATGIHALGVATVLSLFFVILELTLWKLNLGTEFDDTFSRLCMPSGADLAAPPPSAGDVPEPVGNGRSRAGEVLEADGRAVALRIYVGDSASARPAIERVLARDAKRWAATGSETGDGASGVLEYRVRPRKSIGIDALRDHLLTEGAPHVIATDEA
ncbi:MAG: DUF4956 domain-containing protein [Gemmatimonadales bacterium]